MQFPKTRGTPYSHKNFIFALKCVIVNSVNAAHRRQDCIDNVTISVENIDRGGKHTGSVRS